MNTRKVKQYIAARAAILMLATSPAYGQVEYDNDVPIMGIQSTMIIGNSAGGDLESFGYLFRDLAKAGTRVVLTGACNSACTLILMLQPGQLCVTPSASLGFHNAYNAGGDGGNRHASQLDDDGWPVPNVSATKKMREYYPEGINKWIDSHGGLHPWLLKMSGDDLRQFIPAC